MVRRWLIEAASDLLFELGGALGALLLKALMLSVRWRRAGLAADQSFINEDRAKLFAFWHGRQLMMPQLQSWLQRGRSPRAVYTMISAHRDGRLVARAVKYLKVDSVYGSSTRGGVGAAQRLIEEIQRGMHGAITPDGPRGPAQKVKAGVVKIAQKTGAPIIPVAWSARRRWEFKSWDRMILPKPFARGILAVGDPILVPAGLSPEDCRRCLQEVEEGINRVTRICDEYADS